MGCFRISRKLVKLVRDTSNPSASCRFAVVSATMTSLPNHFVSDPKVPDLLNVCLCVSRHCVHQWNYVLSVGQLFVSKLQKVPEASEQYFSHAVAVALAEGGAATATAAVGIVVVVVL